MSDPSAPAEGITRAERKQRTRDALMAAALDLLEHESFSSLSLRRLAKEVGIVPTAFYRHFASVDELGLALVDESFAAVREMVRAVRREDPPVEEILDRSVAVVAEFSRTQRPHFRFIGREMYGGIAEIREAISRGLDQFERELSTDLARMEPLRRWSGADLALLSNLMVQLMVHTAGELINSPAEREAEIMRRARKQMGMIVVGVVGWKPQV
ncbi:TetR family transcriptional regulator [Nocardioidaceae bacterium]|nr:TetR family transcriptional regulator [Nocardioidaceae bacterium]